MSAVSGPGSAASFTDSFLRAFGMVQDLAYRDRQEAHQAEREKVADTRYTEEQQHRTAREKTEDERWDKSYGLQVKADQRAGAASDEALATSRLKRDQAERQENYGKALAQIDALEKQNAPPEVMGQAVHKLVKDTTGVDLLEMQGEDWNAAFDHIGKVKAGEAPLMSEQTLEAAKTLLGPVARRGVGEKVAKAYTTRDGQTIPAGSTIVDKKVAQIIPYQGSATIDLDVTVKTPDGKTLTYGAPLTEGRSTDDTDNVKAVDVRDLLKYAMGMEKLREAGKAMLQGSYLSMPTVAGTRAARGAGGSSAQVQYLQFVADNVFGGDTKKAFYEIQTKPKVMAARIADSLMKQKDIRGKGVYDAARAKAEAESIVQGILEEGPPQDAAAEDAAAGADTGAGGAPQVGDVVDGYRYKGGDPNDEGSWEPE